MTHPRSGRELFGLKVRLRGTRLFEPWMLAGGLWAAGVNPMTPRHRADGAWLCR